MNGLFKYEDLKFVNYNHGGSRVFLENEKYKHLICDTYGDNDIEDEELKKKIHETVRNHFKTKYKD